MDIFLSKNFTLSELTSSSVARRKKIPNVPTGDQLFNLKVLCEKILQPIRDRFEAPIRINSGFRCEALNRIVGGAKGSQHLFGEAADITCGDNRKLWSLINRMIDEGVITVGQLIDEKNLSWIHVSLPSASYKNQIFSLK